jgi:hypothetical protein
MFRSRNVRRHLATGERPRAFKIIVILIVILTLGHSLKTPLKPPKYHFLPP